MNKNIFIFYLTLVYFISASSGITASTYQYSDNHEVVGKIQYHTVTKKDTWNSIAYYYDVGFQELKDANQHVRSLSSYRGKVLIIPSFYILPEKNLRNGIVVNLAEKRLYFFLDSTTVVTYPVSVGKSGWETPAFKGYVVRKKVGPTWYVPKSIKKYYIAKYNKVLPSSVPPGPNNPLGNYAIYLSKRGILIHGTNNELTIGRSISSGCIRMYNRNIQELYYLVNVKTPVYFVNKDEKVGLLGNDLYFEKNRIYDNTNTVDIDYYLKKLEKEYQYIHIDKDVVNSAYKYNTGVPEKIGYIKKEISNYNFYQEDLHLIPVNEQDYIEDYIIY